MFTGIIAAVGTVRKTALAQGGLRLVIEAGRLGLRDVRIGDSVAVNGVCLTVVARKARTFEADVSRATLACTAGLVTGGHVNLEKALRLADRLGGHIVSGHVDGVGTVARLERSGVSCLLTVKAPAKLMRYVARKGSVAVNGVSLTVNDVMGTEFAVNLIPHTLAATNLGELRARERVNLEVDMLARYIERLK